MKKIKNKKIMKVLDEAEPNVEHKWGCNIERVVNGYILTIPNDDGTQEKIVFQYDDDNGEGDVDMLFAFQDMVYEVMQHFAIFNSKHDPATISVSVRGRNGKILERDK